MERLNELVKKASEGWIKTSEFEEMMSLLENDKISVEERLAPLAPLVFGEPDKLNGWMQFAYEAILCELPDNDKRVIEFYDHFSSID